MNKYKSNFSLPLSKFHILELAGALVIAILAGLIFRYVFFTPFMVVDESMYPTLQSGDHILTNRFVKLVKGESWQPKKGDLITFKHPQNELALEIKRIAAQSGDTIEIKKGIVHVNGAKADFLPQRANEESLETPFLDPRLEFESYVIPKPGDTVYLENLGVREFQFALELLKQENPTAQYQLDCTLMLNEKAIPDSSIGPFFKLDLDSAKGFELDSLNWIDLANLETQLSNRYPTDNISFKHSLYHRGELMEFFVVQKNNYFVIGDNWRTSFDSRYWGVLSSEKLFSKPFIIFWSRNPHKWYKVHFKRLLKIVT